MIDSARRPSVAALFLGFFIVGVFGFGGVLPWARRLVVEQRRWLTGPEFTDLLGLCQFLPGGNIMNFSVALGSRYRGVAGGVAALLGLMVAPVAIVIGLGAVYDQFSTVPAVRHGFAGLAAAGAGMVVANATKIAAPLWGKYLPMGFAAVTFGAIAIWRVPLPVALPVLAVASTLVQWRVRA